ncbi:DUF2231 domain-containing protein [Plantactinospora siamensis]|uniref:DUF2231 domain-containing protein n=1 Tax=Plantactinospora siamensis TaxID=555372 RepID=A0ABV6NV76_9ACTN
MFREIMGLPAHALLVHAAVASVPLLVLAAIAYALVPRFRPRVGWLAGILAVGAVGAVYLAKESGEELQRVLVARGYQAEILDQVAKHQGYADKLFWWTLGLGVMTLLLLAATGPRARAVPGWLGWLLSGAVVALGVAAAVYVYLTGDSGAQAVWRGVL